MQAITTKYLGPTDTKGARIVARCQAKRITVAWDRALDVDTNHARAAKKLIEALGWHGFWYEGALPDGTGNVYVCGPTAFEV